VTLRHLELADFRIFHHAHIAPEVEGTTVITGANGSGKTSVLEALAYLGTRRSFRGAPPEALVRTDATRAIVRAELDATGTPTLVDAEISPAARSRLRVNRKPVNGRRDLGAAAPCTVFSPEDLAIVSGGPKGRRDMLDDALGLLDAEGARAADDTERILRQRAALLRQSRGRASAEVTATLDVWDQRLADAGKVLVAARERLVADLAGRVGAAYAHVAGAGDREVVRQRYLRSWEGDLSTALEASREEDLRRGVNTVGPHRDDLSLAVDGREARTHASQGEQRSLALALRLGVHALVRERTELVPILLLDDVFSELDPARSKALVTALPAGQSLVTTASPLPEGIAVARVIRVETLEAA
jgi:DNA replication and repair protein RecF